MESLLLFILTVLIAVVGSWVAQRIKIPAGGMLGAMILVAAFNLMTGRAVFPEDLRVPVQICSGAMIGSRVTRRDVSSFKKVIIPTILLIVLMIIMNLALGAAMYKIGKLDIATSLFATSPGGLTDMALIAESLGANSAYVALLQLIRLITIYMFMPAIVKMMVSKENKKKCDDVGMALPQETTVPVKRKPTKENVLNFLLTMTIAAAGGLLFYYLGVTAGAMLGSMFFTMLFNVFIGRAHFFSEARSYTQVGAGAFLGMRIDMASILGIASLILPVIIEMVGVLIFTFTAAIIIHKTTKLNLCVCMMACTPGGVQEMSILSESLGTDTPKIAVMQSARLVSVIALFPTMLKSITLLF